MSSGVLRRPVGAVALVVVLVFLALSAIAGGAVMVIDPSGGILHMPVSVLAGSVFADFLVPGLALLVLVGFGSLVTAGGVWWRFSPGWLAWLGAPVGRHWSWSTTVLVGVAMIVYEIVEVSVIGYHWLQVLYGGTGAALVVLAWLPPVRAYLAGGAARPVAVRRAAR